MRTVGLFAELNPSRPQVFQGSIHDAVRANASSDERSLVEYLNSGIPLVDIMEATIDVISGDRYVPGGSSLLTDGIWVWRQDLQYYVDRYHLALDRDFSNHASESAYEIVEPKRDQLISLAREAVRDVLNMA